MKLRRVPDIWPLILLVAAMIGLGGCGAARQRNTITPATPAIPEPVSPSHLAPPPQLEPDLLAHQSPLVPRTLPAALPKFSSLPAVFQRVSSRVEAGKRFFWAGDMNQARQEFDRALELLLAADRLDDAEKAAVERRLDELSETIHQFDISGLGGGLLSPELGFEKSPLDEIPEPTFPIDPRLRNQVAEELKTTVSQLPLEITDEVLRYINYFSSQRGRRILEAGLRNAGRYREMILRIFDEEGIPQELIHLAQAESGFAPRAVSRKKAAGLWQFIQSRGREYGLFQTKTTDDRLDPEKATRAAARHLKDLYNQFGDWYLAMAAYNCGPLNVERAVARTGYADFWELRRRNVLPKETANYVPVILAMVIMAKHPEHYGLGAIQAAPPVRYSTITLESATSLELIADIVELPVSELRSLNPALLTNVAPGGYFLNVPAGTSAMVQAALSAIPKDQRASWRLHRVIDGDTLTALAGRYRTTAQKIAALNSGALDGLTPGDLLIVPAGPPPPPVRRAANSRPNPATARRAPAASAARPVPAKPPAAAKASSPVRSARAAGSGGLSTSRTQPSSPAASATAAR